MEGLFIKNLEQAVIKQGAAESIKIVTSGPVDIVVKVPPQHLIADKAARYVRSWLTQLRK